MVAEKSAVESNKKTYIFIVLCFIFIFLDYSNQSIFKKTKNIINDVSSHFSYWIIKPFQIVYNIPSIINEISLLKKESEKIKKLENTIRSLKLKNDYINKEANKLKNFILEESNYSNISVTAKVLYNNKNIFSKSIIINKGSFDGVKIGNPVVKNNNLIGQVIEVNLKSSRVILMEDLNSRIPILIGKNLYQAIMTGNSDLRSNIKFEFLPKVYELKDQDKIFTSEIEGILPKGIYIGKIKLNNSNDLGYSVEFDYNKFNLDRLSVLIPKKNYVQSKK